MKPTAPPRKPNKPIDTNHVCQHLTWLFNNAISGMGRDAVKGTDLYNYQVEFSHLINEIQRGPTYIVPKVIANCNEFINKIIETNQKSKGA